MTIRPQSRRTSQLTVAIFLTLAIVCCHHLLQVQAEGIFATFYLYYRKKNTFEMQHILELNNEQLLVIGKKSRLTSCSTHYDGAKCEHGQRT